MDEVTVRRWNAFARRARWRLRKVPAALSPVSAYFQRTAAYRSERRTVLVWSSCALLCGVALAGFGALIGYGAINVHINAPIDAIASTITKPAVAVPVAFLLLTGVAGCCRGARLGWLAWRPGPIVVSDFAKFGEIDDTKPAQVTALFRDNLSSLLRLESARPSPGAPPETSFLDVLKSGGVSSSDVLSALLSIARASWPAHAFEVEGAIQRRDDPLACGIALHAVRLPNEPAGQLEVWARSWEDAARQAADGVVAAVLPRTRACIGPWAFWRRFRLPVELFTAYREAATLERDRRYDEALSRYRNALALDPTNLTIAIQKGQLLEKIGLLLGALKTYQRVLALANPGRHFLPPGVYSLPARREWRRAVRVAKYRQIVLLGQESLLREWVGGFADDTTGSAKRRRAQFRRELKPLTVPRGDPTADVIAAAISNLIDVEPGPEDLEIAVEKAQERVLPLAYQAAFELQRSLSRWEHRPWELPVSRRTLGLTLAILRWRAELAAGRPEVELNKEFDSAARWAGMSPAIWFGWRPAAGRRWTWQQQYTAACLYSVPLARRHDNEVGKRQLAAANGDVFQPPGPPANDGEEKDTLSKLVRRAVDRLERAAAHADSEFVATRCDWVVEEDPELRGLRDYAEFNAFVAQYFPGRERAARLAAERVAAGVDRRSPARLAQTAYARSLLNGVALQWHELWHQRARQEGSVEPHTLKQWWSEEKEVWTLFAAVTKNCLDRESRLRVLRRANELLARDGIEPVLPRYGQDDASIAQAAGPVSQDLPALMKSSSTPVELFSNIDAHVLQKLAPPAEEQFERRLGVLRRVDAESLPFLTPAEHRRLCLLESGVWEIFGEWLSGERTNAQSASADALGCLARATKLWARAELRLAVNLRVRRAAKLSLSGANGIRRGQADRSDLLAVAGNKTDGSHVATRPAAVGTSKL